MMSSRAIIAAAFLALLGFVVVTSFTAPAGEDRNVPGATTGPGRSSLSD